ncbi:hypothetical protein TWF718_009280 [Orbilia javanica]|uniref:Uncharacterized protein n=1 Tax=Orbilia javanica TaxID=47235 RepID=A0AAN8RCH1_9PEZI
MAVSMESSICSDILSLSGSMPLPKSEYLKKSDVFLLPPPAPPFQPIFIYQDPPRLDSGGEVADGTPAQKAASVLADTMRKVLTKIRSMTFDNVERAAVDINKRRATLRFEEGLQARGDATDLQRISFGVQIPREEFPVEHFDILDEILDDKMTTSLVVEGGDEDKGLQEDYINVSIDIRKNSEGVEFNCIITEDLDRD